MRNKGFSSVVTNEMKLKLPSCSVNEGVARAVVAAFCAQLDPAASELADIKCAVSEAVTNCIVHAYRDSVGWIYITVKILEGGVRVRCATAAAAYRRQAAGDRFLPQTRRASGRHGITVMENFRIPA